MKLRNAFWHKKGSARIEIVQLHSYLYHRSRSIRIICLYPLMQWEFWLVCFHFFSFNKKCLLLEVTIQLVDEGMLHLKCNGRRLPNLHRIQNVTIGLRASAVGSVLSESTERVKHKSREFSGVASSSPVKINSRVSAPCRKSCQLCAVGDCEEGWRLVGGLLDVGRPSHSHGFRRYDWWF